MVSKKKNDKKFNKNIILYPLIALLITIPIFIIIAGQKQTYIEHAATPTVAIGGGNIGICGVAGGKTYVRVYLSSVSTWCVETNFWTANHQSISQFFSYFDEVIPTLERIFHMTSPGIPFTVQVETPYGGAHTGSDFGVGVGVTGDAFYNSVVNSVTGKEVPGFWGYLLTLHEAVNVFTGSISGWPEDWWADHRSPFPNMIDEEVMRIIGQEQNNQTLIDAADLQHERFGNPNRPSDYDSEYGMFQKFLSDYGGFDAYANVFRIMQEDKMNFSNVSANSTPLLSEYTIAYLSLGFRAKTNLTQTFAEAGVGTKDTKITPYTLDQNVVTAIADAHCSIVAAKAQGVDVSTQLTNLQKGNYKNALVSGTHSAENCSSECAFNASTSRCVAPWTEGMFSVTPAPTKTSNVCLGSCPTIVLSVSPQPNVSIMQPTIPQSLDNSGGGNKNFIQLFLEFLQQLLNFILVLFRGR